MTQECIICVHGLWMTGLEMSVLRGRLGDDGYRAEQFRYHTVTDGLHENIQLLRNRILNEQQTVHLLGHSLGGVLALQTLRHYSDLPVDKVVCLGSPLMDSAAGRSLVKVAPGRSILGLTLPQAVFKEPLVEWKGPQAVGVIAGTSSFGPGNMVADLPKPNDGTVALVETWLPGISDHLALDVGHTGMLFSHEVANQCNWFFRHGQFRRA